MKSSDAKASKCHVKFSVYVQLFHFNDNEKNLYLRKMLILEENFRWHSSYVGLYDIYSIYIYIYILLW